MKQVDCQECGDTVVIPDKAEKVTQGETPLGHLKRTGHNYKTEPQLTACASCGFSWYYTGTSDRATCPNCMDKVTAGEVPDEVDFAWERAETYTDK